MCLFLLLPCFFYLFRENRAHNSNKKLLMKTGLSSFKADYFLENFMLVSLLVLNVTFTCTGFCWVNKRVQINIHVRIYDVNAETEVLTSKTEVESDWSMHSMRFRSNICCNDSYSSLCNKYYSVLTHRRENKERNS